MKIEKQKKKDSEFQVKEDRQQWNNGENILPQ